MTIKKTALICAISAFSLSAQATTYWSNDYLQFDLYQEFSDIDSVHTNTYSNGSVFEDTNEEQFDPLMFKGTFHNFFNGSDFLIFSFSHHIDGDSDFKGTGRVSNTELGVNAEGSLQSSKNDISKKEVRLGIGTDLAEQGSDNLNSLYIALDAEKMATSYEDFERVNSENLSNIQRIERDSTKMTFLFGYNTYFELSDSLDLSIKVEGSPYFTNDIDRKNNETQFNHSVKGWGANFDLGTQYRFEHFYLRASYGFSFFNGDGKLRGESSAPEMGSEVTVTDSDVPEYEERTHSFNLGVTIPL